MTDFSKVINYIEETLCGSFGVPGCDIQIMRAHEVLFRKTFGTRDYAGETPVSGNELYFLYSCTKVMTCTAALQLVERGVLGLDDPVSRWIPAYENVFLLCDDERKAPENTMTVRHLFTMTAGLDYDMQKEPILCAAGENPEAGTVEMVASFAKSPLCFEPGERFQYSLCHDVLAAVVEAASGVKFSEYLKQNILEPLGITRTGFELTDPDALMAQFECYEPGRIREFGVKNEFKLSENYESGGAGLISCVEDYSLFADALANGGVGATGKRILRPETIDLMRSEQLSAFTKDPAFSCAAGPGYGYGLGVRTMIDRSQGQRSPIGEFGWDGAAGAYIMIDPENQLSIFFAMHVRGWPSLIGCGHAPIRDLTYEALGL
ncbi:MAG: beta-lactamase family protein [Clostridia bacterium]|nr:beta-lactamase family protein [Clostridia bacterium]